VSFFVFPAEEEVGLPPGLKLTSRGGKKLTLTAKDAPARAQVVEIDSADNGAQDFLNAENSLDVAAVGADLTGAVGDVVKAKVGMKNLGAGTLDSTTAENGVATFAVLVPAGAEAVSVPEVCGAPIEDGGRTAYLCHTTDSLFRSGDTYLVEFGLKIKSLDAEAGAVSVADELIDRFDGNKANNIAPITLGDGDTGGGGTGGAGGGLPVTGVQVGAIAGGGGVLLAAGVVLFLVTRRRRVVLVADDSNN
jgi:hypothetical protein